LHTVTSINYQAKVIKVWALPRSLATTNGIIGYFLFLGVLRCFSSPAYRSPVLYIQTGAGRHNSAKVSPFGHLRLKAYLAAPRSLSQLIASFIGILRQGILCARLSNFLRSMRQTYGFSHRAGRRNKSVVSGCSFPLRVRGVNQSLSQMCN